MSADVREPKSAFVEMTMELVEDAVAASKRDALLRQIRSYPEACAVLEAHLIANEADATQQAALMEQMAGALARYVASDVSMDAHKDNPTPSSLQASNLHREARAALAAYEGAKT